MNKPDHSLVPPGEILKLVFKHGGIVREKYPNAAEAIFPTPQQEEDFIADLDNEALRIADVKENGVFD